MWIASLDFETTGLIDPEPVSVAVVAIERGKAPRTILYMLIKPTKPIEPGAMKIHGITPERVADARPWPDAAADIVAAMEGADALYCFNSPFDAPILIDGCRRANVALLSMPVLCGLVLARALWGLSGNTLDRVAARLEVPLTDAHNAEADATAAGLALGPLIRRIQGDEDPPTLEALAAWTAEKGAEQEAELCRWHRKPNPRAWTTILEAFTPTEAAAK